MPFPLIPIIIGAAASAIGGGIKAHQQGKVNKSAYDAASREWDAAEAKRLARAQAAQEILARRPDLAAKIPKSMMTYLMRPKEAYRGQKIPSGMGSSLLGGALSGGAAGYNAGQQSQAFNGPKIPSIVNSGVLPSTGSGYQMSPLTSFPKIIGSPLSPQ